jgi:hypothetical protein
MPVNYADLLYNQVRAKASHNSYQRKEGLSDQFAYWRIRSLELDLHNSNNAGGWPALPYDWYVYHSSSDSQSSVRTFSEALQLLAGFHAAVPEHEVCTIALDLKDSFDASHTPAGLDALINAALPGCVYTPAQFLGDHSDLQQSAHQWPRLEDLRGKFVFIMTTGNLDSPDSHLNQYVDNGRTANIRTGFVAPEISSSSQITAKNYAVWFNMKIANSPDLGPQVLRAGFMSRGYGGNSQSDWNKGITGQNHLVGTDKVNSLVDPWARTDNSLGWPFQGIELEVDPNTREAGTVIGMVVSSGDIWGKADSCAFCVYANASDGSWTWGVSVPASHTPNDYGKAGLMARASADPAAANFCVLRTAEEHPMRVQVRASQAASTQSWGLQAPSGNGVDIEGWMYLRLTLSNAGRSAEAAGSFDGVNWTSIHRQDFDQPLTLVGLVGSSHDTDSSIRYLWFPVADSVVPDPDQVLLIGSDVRAVGFAGVYPPP